MAVCCFKGGKEKAGKRDEEELPPKPARSSTTAGGISTLIAHTSHRARNGTNVQDPTGGDDSSESMKGDLWYQAYVQCYTEHHEGDAELLDELEETLTAKTPSREAAKPARHKNREDKFKALCKALESSLPARVEMVEGNRWPIPLTNGQVDFGVVVEKFVDVMAMVKDFVGGALSSNPTASLAWSGVCFGIQFVKNPIQAQRELLEGFHAITDTIHRCLSIEKLPQMETESSLKTSTIELYRLVLIFQAEALKHLTRHKIGKVWSDTLKPTHWSDSVKKIKAQEDVCHGIMTQESLEYIVANTRDIVELRGQVEDSFTKQLEVLQDLGKMVIELADEQVLNTTLDRRRLEKASYKAHKRRCLASTRSAILADILTWAARDEPDEKRIFWLTGMAGTGKSTIAATIAEQSAQGQGHTVVSFFFSRNEANQDSTDHLVPTLAMQLVDSSSILKSYICKAMRADHNLFTEKVDEQWRILVQKPLQDLEEANQGAFAPPTVLIVIDGLDECNVDGIEYVVSLLSKLHEMPCVRFRALVTSRPWIEGKFSTLRPTLLKRDLSSDHDVRPEDIDDDIRKYYKHRLVDIRKDYCKEAEPSVAATVRNELMAWPTDDVVGQLVRKSGRLFQYAAVACNIAERDWSGDSPAVKIQSILQSGIAEGLDELYKTALSRAAPDDTALERDRDEFFRRFQLIVGSILFSLEPLSSDDVVSLSGFEKNAVRQFVWKLRSVLSLPDEDDVAIRSVHVSLRELLGSRERCSKVGLLRFHVDKADIQERLFRSCTKLLGSWVPRDYGVDQIMVRIYLEENFEDRCVPSELRYACLFWTAHCYAAYAAYGDATADRAVSVLTEAAVFAERCNQVWMAVLCFLSEPELARKSAVFLENMLDNAGAILGAQRLRKLEDIPRSVFEDLE